MLGRVHSLRVARLWLAMLFVAVAAVPAAAQYPLAVDYYHVDAVGSVRAVTNQSGVVVRTYDYSPFGELESTTCTQTEDPRLYTGQEHDKETCLDYFGARYYRSSSGRFLTIDPVLDKETASVEPQRWNRYAYALNNPTTFVDPDGRNPVLAALGIAWGLYEIGSAAYDIYNAYATLTDPSATWVDQGIAVAGAGLSVVGPGGGYGTAGRLADDAIVVRGGVSELPPPGQVFSGAYGTTLEEAASGVPHGQIRATTAGQIRAGGGTVDVAPELTRSGVMNDRHVNICLGSGPCPFGPPQPNPVPKSGRIQ